MKQSKEPNIITMADWKLASASLLSTVPENERREYIVDLLKILEVLKVGSREKPEKELVFNNEAWALLDTMFKTLDPNQQKKCSLFATIHTNIGKSMQALQNALSLKKPIIQPERAKPESPSWYSQDAWMKGVFDPLKASSIATFSRTSRFFHQELTPMKQKKLEAEYPVIKMFQGTPYNLLTSAHIRGLEKLLEAQTGRFDAKNIFKIEQVIDDSGNLRGIGIYCKEDNPGWLGRGLALSISNHSEKDGVYYAEIDQASIVKLNYPVLDRKFKGQLPVQLEGNHLDTLNKLNGIIENCAGGYMNAYIFENRLSNFNTKTKEADGELKSIMLKITLHPDSSRALLKTMDDFINIYIPAIKKELGEDNFDRIVGKNYGKAVDGSAFINFNMEELKKGLHIEPGAQIQPGF